MEISKQRHLPAPLFILGSPRSFTSVISTMLGQHPETYGVPELNLFIEESMETLWPRMTGPNQFMLHGLLRMVAQLYGGEQDNLTIEMAQRWIRRRLKHSTTDIFYELAERVAPLHIIDKSPVYATSPSHMLRIQQSFPDAYYLHLVRHPVTQGNSLSQVADGRMLMMSQSYDFSVFPPILDPQYSWMNVQHNILNFLDTVACDRKLTMRGEDFLNQPKQHMVELCEWMNLSTSDEAIEDMFHPERSPFAKVGPCGAHLGNDINFLRQPEFRQQTIKERSLDETLSWREDGKPFLPEVRRIAKQLGYR